MNVLINSAAFVGPELAAEFGRLPPVMLPLGIRRLLEHQVDVLSGHDRRLFVSLPDSYSVTAADQMLLDRLAITLFRLPENLSLGESIARCLRRMPLGEPLTLMHGDTLLQPPAPDLGDAWCVAESHDGYRWGYARIDAGVVVDARTLDAGTEPGSDEQVLCGCFQFQDAALLLRLLDDHDSDFLSTLAAYAAHRPVKAVSSRTWSDFGHVQTLYRSRGAYASARVFNHLRIGGGLVIKSGTDWRKIEAEAAWYRDLPAALAPYSARLVAHGREAGGATWYSTEYEYLPTLQELFVFGRLDHHVWSGMLDSCVECLEAFAATPLPGAGPRALVELAVDKTRARMDRFEREHPGLLSEPAKLNGVQAPSVRDIATRMFDVIESAAPSRSTAMHGDFCFSNMMFNSRTRRVRLIDPRGSIDDRQPSVAGDVRYDMAKLAHSVVGYYDLIVCNHFEIQTSKDANAGVRFTVHRSTAQERLSRRLLKMRVGDIGFDDPAVLATMVCLFVAMLPLHSDHPARQRAFMANVQRLYLDLFEPHR